MFYFDEINGKKILRSDLLNAEHFFTTRESFIKTKEPEFEKTATKNITEIIYDKEHNIGAVSHAGWRGTAGNIAAKTVKKMTTVFASDPENLIAVIGPAISMCCYNVGKDVFEKLKATVQDFEGLYEIRNGEIFVDLKGINKRQLEECGVKKIDVCPYCTVCDNDMFFSYRKENATTNRHSAILKLK